MYGGKIPLPKSINIKKFEFYKLCWRIAHVSAAIDYLANVDNNNKWFKNVRENNLGELKDII